jgi:pimeloyl-ACP methyl ester carboxylesterase
VAHTQGEPLWIPTRDGRRLFAQSLPGPSPTSPTVVFECGAAASRSTWALVQRAVAWHARAVVYDRSGLGRSAPDPTSRTLHRMADDLGDVLDHLDSGPYVLVGHSAGGPIARLAAAADPSRIAGLVLVDPSDEGCDVLFGRSFRLAERVAIGVGAVLARTRLWPLLHRSTFGVLPADVRRDLAREGFTPTVVRTHAAQARTFLDELATFRDSPPQLGDVPLTIVSGALAGGGISAEMRHQINAAHAASVERSPRGRYVVAGNSGHYVPVTDPDVVAEEVGRLVTGSPILPEPGR